MPEPSKGQAMQNTNKDNKLKTVGGEILRIGRFQLNGSDCFCVALKEQPMIYLSEPPINDANNSSLLPGAKFLQVMSAGLQTELNGRLCLANAGDVVELRIDEKGTIKDLRFTNEDRLPKRFISDSD
jgi:hypothetical protein